jgi:hypothetical protein
MNDHASEWLKRTVRVVSTNGIEQTTFLQDSISLRRSRQFIESEFKVSNIFRHSDSFSKVSFLFMSDVFGESSFIGNSPVVRTDSFCQSSELVFFSVLSESVDFTASDVASQSCEIEESPNIQDSLSILESNESWDSNNLYETAFSKTSYWPEGTCLDASYDAVDSAVFTSSASSSDTWFSDLQEGGGKSMALSLKVAIAAAVAVLALIILASIIFVFRRRRSNENPLPDDFCYPTETELGEEREMQNDAQNDVLESIIYGDDIDIQSIVSPMIDHFDEDLEESHVPLIS